MDYRFVFCLLRLHSFTFKTSSAALLLCSAHNISTVDDFDLVVVIVENGQDGLNSIFLGQIYAAYGLDCSKICSFVAIWLDLQILTVYKVDLHLDFAYWRCYWQFTGLNRHELLEDSNIFGSCFCKSMLVLYATSVRCFFSNHWPKKVA